MAPLPRRPFKALKDQIQEVQINQKAASGRIKYYTDSDAVQSSENADKGSTNKEKISRQSYTGSTSVSQSGEQFSAKSPGSAEIRVERDQAYTDKDHVAAYIHIYRKLPPNYITKAEARSLGWKDKGTLDQVAPGKSIGGDRFSNYEKILPDAPGRSWKECDIDYVRGNRNAKTYLFLQRWPYLLHLIPLSGF